MSGLATIRLARPPRRPREQGRCYVCGCTDGEPCLVESRRTSEVPCRWIDAEHTICSRCWSPRRPTPRQAGEIIRIRARYGRLRIREGTMPGELALDLLAHEIPRGLKMPGKPPPVVTIAPSGKALGGSRPIPFEAYKGAGATNRLETGKRARGDDR